MVIPMKCNNCNVEWSGPVSFTSKIDVCPFCGKSLKPEPQTYNSIEDVLKYISETFGPETMRNGTKLQSFFADLAPHLRKEKIMLRHFVECDGNVVLLKAKQADKSEAKARIAGVVQRMEDELMVMPDVAKAICRAFWLAIGGDNSVFVTPQVVPTNVTTKTPPVAKPVSNNTQPTPALSATSRVTQKPQPAYKPSTNIPPQSRKVFSDATSPADSVNQNSLQTAHSHWSKPQNQPPAPKPPVKPTEDWKRSEAAHRAWLNSQKGASGTNPAPKPEKLPDDAWKRSEAAHRAWLKSQQNND